MLTLIELAKSKEFFSWDKALMMMIPRSGFHIYLCLPFNILFQFHQISYHIQAFSFFCGRHSCEGANKKVKCCLFTTSDHMEWLLACFACVSNQLNMANNLHNVSELKAGLHGSPLNLNKQSETHVACQLKVGMRVVLIA